MAWLVFFFSPLTMWVTSGLSYITEDLLQNLIPASSAVRLECSMTWAPPGAHLLLLHLSFPPHSRVVHVSLPVRIIVWLPFRKKNPKQNTQVVKKTNKKKRHWKKTKKTKQCEFTTKIFKTKSCVLRWRSTWKRVLRVATEETFRPKWADAGRSWVAAAAAAILLEFKPLALLKAAPLDEWSTAAVRSLEMKFKKKRKFNPKASNAPDVSKTFFLNVLGLFMGEVEDRAYFYTDCETNLWQMVELKKN